MVDNINEQRIRDEFAELVEIDSLSFAERDMADCLKKKLLSMGFSVEEDNAGSHYNGNAGNVYGYLKGTLPGEPILLSAHMDVVEPGIGRQAVFSGDGRITSAGDTVLGADDAAGIVEILEGIRTVLENGLPHRDIEVLFPIGEELYIKGTNVFDFEKIRARDAYVLDLSGKIGTAALQAPSIISFQVTVRGKAAHAGFEPEKGIHAVALMSKAIGKIKQGHIDEKTTFNIGTVMGGVGTNIVPESCVCRGEVRSYVHTEALQCIEIMRDIFEKTLAGTGAEFDIQTDVHMKAYKIDESDSVVRRFCEACAHMNIACKLTCTFGGSDNNNFVEHGLHGIVLSCGMYQVHSTEEYATVEDLRLGAVLVAELVSGGCTNI